MVIFRNAADQLKEIKPVYFGFALYLAFRFFYVHNIDMLIEDAGLTEPYFLGYFLTLFIAKLVFSAIYAFFSYRNPRQEEHSPSTAAAIFIAIGLLILTLLFVGDTFHFGNAETLLLLTGSGILLGVGDSLMISLWGRFTSTLSMRKAYIFILSSYLVALTLSALSGFLPPAFLAAYIVLGCMTLPFLLKRSIAERPAFEAHKPSKKTMKAGLSRTWRYLLLAGLFAFLSNFTSAVSSHQPVDNQTSYLIATIVTFAVVLSMLGFALFSPKRFDIDLTYRFALPLAAGGLLLLGFLWNIGGNFATSMVAMGWLLSDLVTWCVIANVSARLRIHPFVLFGISQVIFSIAIILGAVGGYLFSNTIGYTTISLLTAALIGIYLLSTALVFLLRDRRINALVDVEQDHAPRQEKKPTNAETEQPSHPERTPSVRDRFQERVHELSEQTDLTPREIEILRLLAQGRNTQYMAETLFVSENTVKSHVKNVYRKLGVHSKQDVIALINNE